MFYLFLLFLAAIGGLVYFFFFMQSVPGAAEERFGKLEPLPQDLGVWTEDKDSPAALAAQKEGLKREQRLFFEESRQRLLKQGRYRSLSTNEVVKVDRDEVVKRRRLKS